MASEGGRSAMLSQAQAALDAAARIGVDQLDAALAHARTQLRRACALGQAHGGPARQQAVAALAAAQASLGTMPDVRQLAAALAMYTGHAVETASGQGRALSAALAAMLHVWSGRDCHVVCGGDFQAVRDHAAMQPLFALCGCTAAALGASSRQEDAATAYAGDIVYAGARQLLSDHMRDQMLLEGAATPMRRQLRAAAPGRQPLMRGTAAAIISDIEAVLADDGTSPVILSAAGQLTVLSEASMAACAMAAQLRPGVDYEIEAGPSWRVSYTAEGEQRVHDLTPMLPVYWRDPRRLPDLVEMALLARDMLEAERHYVVQEGRVILTDESVLRHLGGRVWQQGPLQAVEAREQVTVSAPPRTVARAALQSFFPRYEQLGGAGSSLRGLQRELAHCYRLPVLYLTPVRVRAAPRTRYEFVDSEARLAAFVEQVLEVAGSGRAVLASAPKSADLAAVGRALADRAVSFQLVDGRDPQADVQTMADAALPGRVTLMAGACLRSVDPVQDEDKGEGRRPVPMLYEHWDVQRGDEAFFAWGEGGIVFGARAELAQRPLPMWAAWLPLTLRVPALAPAGARLVVRLSQWHVGRYASRYRQALAERESQLDEQLAFSRKA